MSLTNRPSARFAALLAFAIWVPSELWAESNTWPQWRGPTRDSLVTGTWPDNLQGLEKTWRIVLDKGYPGPIVGPQHVFVAETASKETEIVRALDRASGVEVWRASWPGKGSVPFFASRNGDWIRSTPAFDGETLFVGGMNELLVALDAQTGEERWRVDFPATFGTKVPDFGFSTSPLVDGEFIYVQAADSLFKLDKATGTAVWRSLDGKADIMSSGAFSSPVLATLEGKRQLIVQSRTHLHGIDPADGTVLWKHEVPSFRGMNILTPVVYGDGIFTSTYRNSSYFYRVHTTDAGLAAQETWTHKAQAYMSSPVIIGDNVFVHLGNGRLAAIGLESGEERWTTSERFGSYLSMISNGDKILGLSDDGALYLVSANAEQFELLDKATISEQETWAHLAIAGDEIFVRELKAITAYRWRDASTEDASPAKAESAAPDARDG